MKSQGTSTAAIEARIKRRAAKLVKLVRTGHYHEYDCLLIELSGLRLFHCDARKFHCDARKPRR